MNFTYDEKQKKLMRSELVVKEYGQQLFIMILVFILQICMIVMLLLKPGGVLYTWRRTAYVGCYVIQAIITIIILILYRELYKRKNHLACYWLRIVYGGIVCLWGCTITFIDQFGGDGVALYCFVIPTVAALVVMPYLCSCLMFSGMWILLNIIMLFIPGAKLNIFNNVVNSSFVTAISIFISIRLIKGKEREFISRQMLELQYKEIQRANRKLNSLVLTDALTQLNNRRYLDDFIAPVFENNIYNNQVVAGVMIDIDCFKQYNDTYGHQAGDDCLVTLGKEILILVESKEYYAVRYGGEEFFLCKFGASKKEIVKEIEELRLKTASYSFGESIKRNITISAGIHMDVVNSKLKLENLIKYADDALYEAKSKGRNCIRIK